MAAKSPPFTEEEMAVDEGLGYPRAYAKLCRSSHSYGHGPPFAFVPYALQPQQSMRAKDLNQMFPIIDPEAKPSVNPKNYINLLWKQLSHLGNAGFDPALFRLDPYGNVLYFHADSASPLSWDVDHWFPCPRGGKTVLGNLRLLQWQVCKKKHNKLEFLIPWWDLQLGIPANQFLSIFASRNSDFRSRAFSFLFAEGGSEELNELQVVESHTFPPHFTDLKRQVGLAPAAIVLSHRNSDASSLRPLSLRNRPLMPISPSVVEDKGEGLGKAIQRFQLSKSKENDDPNMGGYDNNPYLSISMARDSLREREETKKKKAELQGVEDELNELKQNTETERLALQDLEVVLIKRRRRVEKCRRLAEAQASYRALLEKMIRDAMHQSVVYKEQVRLNQAAASALLARLEAQKAICDSSERELHSRYKLRDELEKQIMPYCGEQVRKKRSRMDDTLLEGDRKGDTARLLQERRIRKSSRKKELRKFLEEEQKASEAGMPFGEETEEEEEEEEPVKTTDMERVVEYKKLKKLAIEEGSGCKTIAERNHLISPIPPTQDDEEYKNQIGKENIDKWLQMLLENTEEGLLPDSSPQNTTAAENVTEEIICKLNSINPQKEIKFLRLKPSKDKARSSFKYNKQQIAESISGGNRKEGTTIDTTTMSTQSNNMGKLVSTSTCKGIEVIESSRTSELKGRLEKTGSLDTFARSESARTLRRFPSSPSVILGMRRKGMDCIGRKPMVIGDSEDDDNKNIG